MNQHVPKLCLSRPNHYRASSPEASEAHANVVMRCRGEAQLKDSVRTWKAMHEQKQRKLAGRLQRRSKWAWCGINSCPRQSKTKVISSF